MAEDVNVKVIKKTQDRLGKYIKKPPLQEKLLKRPPFRFLHDIITNVVKTTSFLKGLYTTEELISDNVKDKESKIRFLQKAIDALIFVTGDKLEVKPSKIVAGHEAGKTNEFLQCIAKAIRSKADSSEAVQKVLNGEKPEKRHKMSPTKKANSASLEKKNEEDIPLTEVQNEPEHNGVITEGGSEKRKESSRKSDRSSSRNPDKHREKSRSKEERLKDKTKHKSRSSHGSSRRQDKKQNAGSTKDEMDVICEEKRPVENTVVNDTENTNGETLNADQSMLDESESPENDNPPLTNGYVNNEDEAKPTRRLSVMKDHRLVTPRPPSAKGPRKRVVGSNSTPKREKKLRDVLKSSTSRSGSAATEPGPPPPTAASMRSSSARPSSRLKSARPSSARPAPPRIHRKDIIEDTQTRPESVKPPDNIILQESDEDNEDDMFTVMQDKLNSSGDVLQNEAILKSKSEENVDEAQGSLVKQLLETKKDLEGGSQRETQKIEIERPLIDNSQRRKQRELVAKEIDSLRGTIQTLTRSANPLGKLMDYLQEDIDSMQKEWQMWHQEYLQNSLALKQEKSKTDNSLEPLKVQLADLDTSIESQQAKIHNFKSKIIHNEEKLQKLLSSNSFASK